MARNRDNEATVVIVFGKQRVIEHAKAYTDSDSAWHDYEAYKQQGKPVVIMQAPLDPVPELLQLGLGTEASG